MGWLKKALGIQEEPQVTFTQITDDNFQKEVIEASKPVMLFVWSDSCPHCKRMAPNVKMIGGRFAEFIKPAHTNSGWAPSALAALGVRGVPTLIFFNHGKVIEHVTGFRPETYLEELIQAHFAGETES